MSEISCAPISSIPDIKIPFPLEFNKLSEIDFNLGEIKIKESIPTFEYSTLINSLNSLSFLKNLYLNSENNYTKLNVFRLIYEEDIQEIPSVLRKFINETFHIENELICQLDPNDYDLIPDFIVEECNKYVEEK